MKEIWKGNSPMACLNHNNSQSLILSQGGPVFGSKSKAGVHGLMDLGDD
jgi:hypothetical protein